MFYRMLRSNKITKEIIKYEFFLSVEIVDGTFWLRRARLRCGEISMYCFR